MIVDWSAYWGEGASFWLGFIYVGVSIYRFLLTKVRLLVLNSLIFTIGSTRLHKIKEDPTETFYLNGRDLVLGHEALRIFVASCRPGENILDVGCGEIQTHSVIMKENALNPKTCDLAESADYTGFYEKISFENEFDAIWCCHVFEHTLNPHDFLLKLKGDIKEGGLLAITVPPLKHAIVGGHVNLFNAGLLLYRLILAGFDCSQALIGRYGYNISVVTRVKKISELPKDIAYDAGDIERLSHYFPFRARQDFDGNDLNICWDVDRII